ncbi:MAG: Cas10/Cmr2 second palm domain-containing protein [Bryobacteraceae bacterium]
MSEQILLQGKILGIEEFLLSPSSESELRSRAGEELLSGRAQWITLLSEVLPRALLAELGLARVLLGSSGGAQFLVVLPEEARPAANEFLTAAARDIDRLSDGHLQLLWGSTENLGDWSVVRRRLNDELDRWLGAPLAGAGADAFRPYSPAPPSDTEGYFSRQLGMKIREATQVGWSPEHPARILPGEGKHTWRLTPNVSTDGITVARHAAPGDDAGSAATVGTLARRAQGRHVWGVLRGDVDNFGVRLRRLHNIEEHVPLSVLYKQFFAGELEVLCSLPEFWRKVTILYSGGDDFAVYGAWDALLAAAREMQRLFHRFTEENLKDFPGAEGKTITMALALAPTRDASLAEVYEQAGRNLAIAKAADKDCIYVLGRVLEWKQLSDAAELKEAVSRMAGEHRARHQMIGELRGLYGKTQLDRVWRFHRRLHFIVGAGRDREFQKLRTHLIGEGAGRRTTQVKLRPSGLVALQWAELLTEV